MVDRVRQRLHRVAGVDDEVHDHLLELAFVDAVIAWSAAVTLAAPATVLTPSRKTMLSDPKLREGMLGRIPTGRFVTPEEVAALVCWLASEECTFSTGAVYDISGLRISSPDRVATQYTSSTTEEDGGRTEVLVHARDDRQLLEASSEVVAEVAHGQRGRGQAPAQPGTHGAAPAGGFFAASTKIAQVF